MVATVDAVTLCAGDATMVRLGASHPLFGGRDLARDLARDLTCLGHDFALRILESGVSVEAPAGPAVLVAVARRWNKLADLVADLSPLARRPGRDLVGVSVDETPDWRAELRAVAPTGFDEGSWSRRERTPCGRQRRLWHPAAC